MQSASSWHFINPIPIFRRSLPRRKLHTPGAWISANREAVVEELLLPLAKEAGFSFTVEDLRSYETAVYLDKHRDEEQDPDAPDDDTVFFLLDRGWTNDATAEFSKA